MKSLLKNLVTLIFCSTISIYAAPPFSKVVIFGDSLSDIGNNHFNIQGQAPETNFMPDGHGGYKPGEVWVIPFVKDLQQAGLLTADATQIFPSRCLTDDQNGQDCPDFYITTSHSLDFAYSGDPSGGYIIQNGHYVNQLHMLAGHFSNLICVNPDSDLAPSAPWTANTLCGVKNRVTDFVTHTNPFQFVDPNALYVIWVGPNDINQNLGPSLQAHIQNGDVIDPNADNPVATRTVQAAVMNITSSISALILNGARYFVVYNLPNLGFTQQGYGLNYLYNNDPRHASDPKDAIKQLFTNLTNGFNIALSTSLDNLQSYHSGVTIIQPDINTLFNQLRDGEIAAFPTSSATLINKEPVLQWYGTCCPSNGSEFDYNPAQCKTTAENPLCSGAEPKLPAAQGGGHYLFFNAIHPTTCAHKYIAAFASAAVEKIFSTDPQPFDPSINLCE